MGLFRDKKKTSRAVTIEDLEAGRTLCDVCGADVPLATADPLSLVPCPQCRSAVFLPMKVDEWWATTPIGSGGFGAVYLGIDPGNPEAKAAIKVLKESSVREDHTVDRFLHEAEVAAAFSPSPHLAAIYSYGTQDNVAFIVMEHLAGVRMSDYIKERDGALSTEESLYYTLDILEALTIIEDAGFLYRDMKPENVILRTTGLAALIDYGECMSIEDAALPGEGPIIGSPLCVPPERCLRQGEDVRSEIYSLGMVLHFMLRGEHFFAPNFNLIKMDGTSDPATAALSHTKRARLQTKSKLHGLDEDVIALVDRMIRRNPEERLATYDDVREAIFEVLSRLLQEETQDPFLLGRRQHFFATYAAEPDPAEEDRGE